MPSFYIVFALATLGSMAFASPLTNSSMAPMHLQEETSSPLPSGVANQSLPLFPGLIDSLLLRPLVDFNNRISQAAVSIPEHFSQKGQTIGSAILRPIQLANSTVNQVASRLNDSLISLSNSTATELVQPILLAPVNLIGRVHSSLHEGAVSALNSTANRVGGAFTNMGETISNAGQDVQHLGATIMNWVQSLEQLRQQLADGNTNHNGSVAITIEQTAAVTTEEVITFAATEPATTPLTSNFTTA